MIELELVVNEVDDVTIPIKRLRERRRRKRY